MHHSEKKPQKILDFLFDSNNLQKIEWLVGHDVMTQKNAGFVGGLVVSVCVVYVEILRWRSQQNPGPIFFLTIFVSTKISHSKIFFWLSGAVWGNFLS